MDRKLQPLKLRLIRIGDRFFDAIGLRPLGIVVFAGSAVLFLYVIGLSAGGTRADGVAVAGVVDHPSLVSSFTTVVFVKQGDRVEIGAPLVELSSYFLDREQERVDLEIAQLLNESRLRAAEYADEAKRRASPSGVKLNAQSLVGQLTIAHFDTKLETLSMRRRQLLEQREALIVLANAAGIVSDVAGIGASIAEGASVASVMPAFAEEIVAYVSPTIDPARVASGVATYLVGSDTRACRAAGHVRNRGARVEQAPKQLSQFMGIAVHGMPVHVTLPPDCRLINGQALALNFRSEDSQ